MKKATQAEVNIGVVGHVDHGKTSLTKALTGEWADRHSEEIKRGITIRLGYADATIYKYDDKNEPYGTQETNKSGKNGTLVRKVSFVDCPGHESLMSAMISGSALMDGALLVIAANEECPQEQTKEHLRVLELIGLKNIVIVQNKIDLVTKEQALSNYKQIQDFVKNTIAENAPIIPIAAHYNLNIGPLLEAIESTIKTPTRKASNDLKMLIARSFDINKPGIHKIDDINGGVIGGSIISGKLAVGDEIEIVPGINNKPLRTKVMSLSVKGGQLKEAVNGGLVGVGTLLDPAMTKGDRLIGSVLGYPEKTPPVKALLELETTLINREPKVDPIKPQELLVLNVGTSTTVGTSTSIAGNKIKILLKKPVSINNGDRTAISRRINGKWTLIGIGTQA